ncbi:nucleoside hydrolase [Gemmiger formicilis]|uniref:nucleoside hydrolase n=1 Tax=Gemmiger formicilis TaxID=745368 RepID=UPI001FAEE197|nr:nucleoside hydrolase [Gemmiger formicilis]
MNYSNYHFSVTQEKMVRVITDTDAKNEADDPFAVVQAILSPRFENVGFIAAHFGTDRVPDSMEQSYRELETIFEKMDLPSEGVLYRGAVHAMSDRSVPVDSEGARLIVREAMKEDSRPLYILFLGPLTDLASAYLMEPRIAGRLKAIWIGGGKYPTGSAEFNLDNDRISARVVFSSPIELWQVP